MSDQRVLVCTPKALNPYPVPGSEVRWCSVCADEVWVSPDGLRFEERTPNMTMVCFDCAVGMSDTLELQVEPVPGAVDTLGHLNMRPALREFKRRVKERRERRGA